MRSSAPAAKIVSLCEIAKLSVPRRCQVEVALGTATSLFMISRDLRFDMCDAIVSEIRQYLLGRFQAVKKLHVGCV